MKCDFCGSSNITEAIELQQFAYRSGLQDVLLTANVPTIQCNDCGEIWITEAGERVQHEAVCAHLRRLAPSEIKARRSKMKMSQAALAQHLGVGIASVKRWETGSVIQNEAMDRIIRNASICDQSNVRFPTAPIFRTQLPSSAFRAAKTFQLRVRDQ